MTYKVFVVGDTNAEKRLFVKHGWETTRKIAEASLVLFTGGEDINPVIYEQHVHGKTWFNSHRDKEELAAYEVAKTKRKLMAGICRGAQLLNALCGGSMYQDVDNHAGGVHEAFDTLTGETIMVNSVHHQMMIPNVATAKIMLEATESTKRTRMSQLNQERKIITEICDFTDVTFPRDIEAIAYPDDGVYGIQGHPEYCVWDDELGLDWVFFDHLQQVFEFKEVVSKAA